MHILLFYSQHFSHYECQLVKTWGYNQDVAQNTRSTIFSFFIYSTSSFSISWKFFIRITSGLVLSFAFWIWEDFSRRILLLRKKNVVITSITSIFCVVSYLKGPVLICKRTLYDVLSGYDYWDWVCTSLYDVMNDGRGYDYWEWVCTAVYEVMSDRRGYDIR